MYFVYRNTYSMKFILSAITCIFIFASCTKESTATGNETATQKETFSDVSYGTDAKQKIDIYLPEGRSASKTKTIVIIHGGGWTEGDKSEMKFGVDSLQIKLPEYAIININYRLAYNNTTNLFPTQQNDVKSAIDFYLSKSSEYKVSKDLVVLGASAGGHLAMLYSYKDDADKHVKAVIDFFGPTDLPALWNAGLVQQLILISATGKTYDQDHDLYFQSSPVNFITPQSPPTIAIQGGADPLVPPSQTSILIGKLQEKLVTSQLVYYESGGHGNWPLSTYSDAFTKIYAFVTANVH
jgi:acetyl esterase/lipase